MTERCRETLAASADMVDYVADALLALLAEVIDDRQANRVCDRLHHLGLGFVDSFCFPVHMQLRVLSGAQPLCQGSVKVVAASAGG